MFTIPEVEEFCKKNEPVPPSDNIYARMHFPFKKIYYPLGFPVEIATNSSEILQMAEESWGVIPQLFQTAVIRMQVGVLESEASECPPAPICRVQQHIFSTVANSENYGMYDMSKRQSLIWLTSQTLRFRSYVRQFFLESAVMAQISTNYVTGVHAGCVARNGVGVLLCGDSGAGKSTLTFACAKAGWTYITDDGSYVVHGRDDLLVVGNCNQVRFRPSTSAIFPEIEGRETTQRELVGKPSIELPPTAIADIEISPTARVEKFVILNRREGVNESLRPYPKRIIRKFLMQNRFAPLDKMPLHEAAIDRALQLDVLELRYRDLSWAIEQLESLVDQVNS